MGLYGSPDTGNLYTEVKEKKIKLEGYKPQKNIWVWIAVGIVNLVFFLISNKNMDDILTLIMLDSMVIFGISFISMIINLFKKRKTSNDIKFIGISIILFFISGLLISTV